ncbi:MAG TPA: transglycosylase domain-containing protein, partial [Gaiellaceae bacterium]|nr:transglycosylase domain-containing protein [Gaiellaceae bacterium]
MGRRRTLHDDDELLLARARRRRRRAHGSARRWLLLGAVALVLLWLTALAGAAAFAHREYRAFEQSCDLSTATARQLGQTSFVYAADDTFLGAIRTDTRRIPVSRDEMSPWLERAFVAIEDRRFYEHDGLDLRAIARAAVENVRAGETVEGASTITQQLARNLYLTPERTLERKKQEACVALALEREWGKERILTAYMNRVYLGHRAYGVEAAAQTYFGRRASQLGPTQAALIAGLVQAPSQFDPLRHPERALQRRNAVLRAMHELGTISTREYRNAVALPLNLRPGTVFTVRREPYFLDYVRRQLVEHYGEERVRRGGLRVYTTVLPRYQGLALQAMRDELGQPGDPSAALAAVDPANGAIRTLNSLVPGSRPDFNLAFQGRRQAGSSFKTFALVEAIRRGVNPYATRYVSEPFSHPLGHGQPPWEPKTYDGSYYGLSTLAQATLRSDNVVYAKLGLDLGPGSIAALARRMGIRSEVKPVPSIVLGVASVSPLELASAYATIAGGGVHHEPFSIRRVELPDGTVDEEAGWGPKDGVRVFSQGVAHHVTNLLAENVQRGTGTRAQIGRPAAGKTGTTDDHTDAWFAGYTPRLAVAVWVGYPERTRQMLNVRGVRVTGGSFPAGIWGRFVGAAESNKPPVPFFGAGDGVEWKDVSLPRADGRG